MQLDAIEGSMEDQDARLVRIAGQGMMKEQQVLWVHRV